MGIKDFPKIPKDLSEEIQSAEKYGEHLVNMIPGEGLALSEDLSQIQNIAAMSQNFINVGLMSRGLTVDNFAADAPGKNWKKSYPFRFLVTKVDSLGKHTQIAQYRLPIAPSDLTVSTQFAIKTTITSRGILEEHNGAPIRQIVFSGSTGIYLARGNAGKSEKRSIIGGIFSGTTDAFGLAVKQAASTFSPFDTGKSTSSSKEEDLALTQTGWYQFQMLDLFLHTYAEAKKHPNNQNLRLIFEIAKDKVQYVVTPQSFVKKRTSNSPMEYLYQVSLLAWATVPDYKGSPASDIEEFLNTDINSLQRSLLVLSNLRRTVQNFRNIVSAVRADVESNIFGPINQTILLLKDSLSVPLAIADLPKALRDSFQTSVAANWQSLSQTNEDLKKLFDTKFQSIINEGSGNPSYLGASKTQAGGEAAPTSTFKPEVLDDLDLTENVQLDQLQLNNNQQVAVQAAIDDAKDISINEVNTLIAQLTSLTTALEPQIQDKNAMDEEWDLLYSLNDSITELYGLIANGQLNKTANEEEEGNDNAFLATSALSFWEQSTANAGIEFTTPSGKFSVPFPLGATLEQLALVYLGDATRWMEIVALNGLQAPYVDEDGFTYSLIGNGSENQINITSANNLYVNQTIYISSDTQLTTKRKIQSISKVSDTNFLITVDGDPNLDVYTTSENAQILAYLPYTVNSMKQIYIPTDTPPTQDQLDTPPITFLDDDADMIKFSKIDWLLTPQGDLNVTKDGFMNLAFGKTNLLQAAKMKLLTKPGSLLLHPSFGAGVEVGDNFAEIELNSIAKRISKSFVEDPRFLAPSSIDLNAYPGVLKEDIVAVIAKDDGILPISIPLTK